MKISQWFRRVGGRRDERAGLAAAEPQLVATTAEAPATTPRELGDPENFGAFVANFIRHVYETAHSETPSPLMIRAIGFELMDRAAGNQREQPKTDRGLVIRAMVGWASRLLDVDPVADAELDELAASNRTTP